MKTHCSTKSNQAMTLIEAVVVILVIGFFAVLLLPALLSHHSGAQRISCTNNLKQLVLADKIWAGDYNDKYPMEVSVTNGGAMEYMNTADAWKAFQVMSNELSTPKIIICPEDSLRGFAATNFGEELKNKISYFVGRDATDTNPFAILSGDSNFLLNQSAVKPGLINVTTNDTLAWDATATEATPKLVGSPREELARATSV